MEEGEGKGHRVIAPPARHPAVEGGEDEGTEEGAIRANLISVYQSDVKKRSSLTKADAISCEKYQGASIKYVRVRIKLFRPPCPQIPATSLTKRSYYYNVCYLTYPPQGVHT